MSPSDRPVALLQTQFRMHPAIRAFPSRHFYEGQLRDAQPVSLLASRSPGAEGGSPAYLGVARPDLRLAPYVFFNLRGGRQQQAGGSHSLYNAREAAFCAQLLAALRLSAERWGREAGAGGGRPRSPADAPGGGGEEAVRGLGARGRGGGGGGGGGSPPRQRHGSPAGRAEQRRPHRPRPSGEMEVAGEGEAAGAAEVEEGEVEEGELPADRSLASSAPRPAEAFAPRRKRPREEGSRPSSRPGSRPGSPPPPPPPPRSACPTCGDAEGCGFGSLCGKVSMLTPYNAQIGELERACRRRSSAALAISNVDTFQGKEADVVIYSGVRSGGGGIGFVSDLRRLNVALTRARHALYIVGSEGSLNASPDWRALLADARARGCVFDVDAEAVAGWSAQQVLESIPLSTLDGLPTADAWGGGFAPLG